MFKRRKCLKYFACVGDGGRDSSMEILWFSYGSVNKITGSHYYNDNISECLYIALENKY